MHIDWFVLLAQIINFLILVYLLKRFLYNRILGAIDTREAKIASRFDEAEKLKADAAKEMQAYEDRNRDLQEKADEMMNRAQKAAEKEKGLLMDKVREEADQVRDRWHDTLNRENNAFMEDLRRRSGVYIYDTIRHVLADMADETLEDSMVRVFVSRVCAMDQEQQEKLRDSLKDRKSLVTLRSAFGLNSEQRQTIEDALQPYTAAKPSMRYEVTSSIGAGVEVMTRGYKFSWSINDYLASLEEKFASALKEEIHIEGQAI